VKYLTKTINYLLPALSAASIATTPVSALAEETLKPVVVTATRTARSADETLASVSVITRKDIERLQAHSLQDLLRNEVGFSVTNNGGAGKRTSAFIRGTESDHVLVLIDGIKVGSATSGDTAYQNLNIDQIERIEIVRGPRSSLYGAGAIGGVIQIFTRKGGKATTPSFSTSAGKYNSKKVNVGVSGGGKSAWYNIGFSGFSTTGFNSCSGSLSAGCFTVEPDKDGYREQAGSLRAGYRFQNGVETDFTLTRTEGSTEFDGNFQNEGDSVQQIIGGSLKFSPTANWYSTLTIGRSSDESDNFKDGIYSSTFDTERDSISWQNDITLYNDQLLTLGVDYIEDNIFAVTFAAFPVTSRDNTGIFAQYQSQYGTNDFIMAVRQDDNEQFGKHTTGSLSWGYAINNKLRLIASYGTAYKAPSFNELYFPFYGIPTLQPESSRTFEAGIKGKSTWGLWDITAYKTEIDDLIVYDASIFGPANISSASIVGLETRLKTRIAKWDINGNLTLLDTTDKSPGVNNGNKLARRVKTALNINLDRDYGKMSTGLSAHVRSSAYDDTGNTRKIKGYTTVDVRAAYQFAKNWLIQARIDNVFDKNYETASFYNQPKGDFWLTLRYQPENK